MSEEKTTLPASKISFVKSKTNVDNRGFGTSDYSNLTVESQTDDGALDLLKKAKAELKTDVSQDP